MITADRAGTQLSLWAETFSRCEGECASELGVKARRPARHAVTQPVAPHSLEGALAACADCGFWSET